MNLLTLNHSYIFVYDDHRDRSFDCYSCDKATEWLSIGFEVGALLKDYANLIELVPRSDDSGLKIIHT